MNDPEVVLDASAVLAVLLQEPGQDKVSAPLERGGACVCSVNLAEVIAKLTDHGMAPELAAQAAAALEMNIIPFDESLARVSGALRPLTRDEGLSLGDRCCLAVARQFKIPALTADKAWANLRIGVKIKLIR